MNVRPAVPCNVMAKVTEPKNTTATEPTITPPPIVPSPPDSETEAASPDDVPTEPEIVSALPQGVVMHDAGRLPYTTDRAARAVPDPTQPPPGWKGSFSRCGACGDFLGTSDRCPRCAPARLPANIVNGGPQC